MCQNISKSSVGLFQKYFASISETVPERIVCHN